MMFVAFGCGVLPPSSPDVLRTFPGRSPDDSGVRPSAPSGRPLAVTPPPPATSAVCLRVAPHGTLAEHSATCLPLAEREHVRVMRRQDPRQNMRTRVRPLRRTNEHGFPPASGP